MMPLTTLPWSYGLLVFKIHQINFHYFTQERIRISFLDFYRPFILFILFLMMFNVCLSLFGYVTKQVGVRNQTQALWKNGMSFKKKCA